MMQPILDWLYQSVFAIGGTPVTVVELLGFVLGVATVWLVAKANIWTFPIGIVQAGMFFVLFLEARLYADMWLQVFFIAVQIVGWWAWLKAGPNRTKLRINNMPKIGWLAIVGVLAGFVFIMTPVLREAHGAYPVADASTTGMSVIAQFLLTWKLIENWYLWILADIIYIPLYFAKDLYFTSILYVIFLLICIRGLLYWKAVKDGRNDGGGTPNSAYAREVADAAKRTRARGRTSPV
jgi:nicotinamide mononucleotide transporter